MASTNITKKIKKLAKEEIESMPEANQRYYAVWRYWNKHKCDLTQAYQAIYKCSYESAKSSASRMKASPEWLEIVDRMEEAASTDPDALKHEIVASMLSIMRNPKGYPADKVKAASVLSGMFGLSEQKITVAVSKVETYVQNVLMATQQQPIVPPQNDLLLDPDGNTIS